MKIEKQLLVDFSQGEMKTEYTTIWPVGSKFLQFVVAPGGILMYMLVPEMEMTETEPWVFFIDRNGGGIDVKDEFIEIITYYSEVSPEMAEKIKAGHIKKGGKEEDLSMADFQAMVIFPIFRKNLDHLKQAQTESTEKSRIIQM